MYKWDGRPMYPVDSYHHYRENMNNKCYKKSKGEDKHKEHKHDDKCKLEKKTYENRTPIQILGNAASTYPSQITVKGLKGCIKHVTVKLRGFSHTNPEEVHILLVDPEGHAAYLMGSAGGGGDANNLNITFDDCATRFLPDTSQLFTGTFKPSVYEITTAFQNVPATPPSPNPPGPPYVSALSLFNGEEPNGTWSLYVMDTVGGITNTGNIAKGWSLTICTDCECKCGCDSKKEK